MAARAGPPGLTRLELEEWYRVEQGLAERLRTASKAERKSLYSDVYDQLFRQVPQHPQIQRRDDPSVQQLALKRSLTLLGPLLKPETVFLEIGAGDCSVSIAIARQVKKAYALDVSAEMMPSSVAEKNLELVVSDGTTIPVADNSVDLAFSNQLMEHLHPDDALEQLVNIHRALKPGGRYLCVTPNRVSGPHDVTRYFSDPVARGFHLKEYSSADLCGFMKQAGFRSTALVMAVKGRQIGSLARPLAFAIEGILEGLPDGIRRPLATSNYLKPLLGVRALATK